MKEVTLNNGVKMPAIGFGVFQIPDHAACQKAVEEALEVGYQMIDTAASYMNEEAVGAAIKASGLPREEVFVTTKLWVQDHGYENTLKAFDTSMAKLGLDYLDLYLIHKPYGDYYGSWRAMEHLYKEGRIKAIGVTSFPDDRMIDLILHNEIKPAVNQIETHPWLQQEASAKFLSEEGIVHEAWAPFAEGHHDIFRNPVIASIGAKYGKTNGQVILRWLNQRNVVVIPKSVHKERMIENLNIFDFMLTDEDMALMSTLDRNEAAYDDRAVDIVKWISGSRIHD